MGEKLSKEELVAYYGEPVDEESPFERLAETKMHLPMSAGDTTIRGNGRGDGRNGIPTEDIRCALLDYVEDPFQDKTELAERWGINKGNLLRAIHNYQPWIEKESERVWRAKKPLVMRKMEELALDDKNFKALEFILRCNGFNPAEKVVSDQDITVTVQPVYKQEEKQDNLLEDKNE